MKRLPENMPDVLGLFLEDAEALLEAAGLVYEVRETSGRRRGDLPGGSLRVIRVTCEGGSDDDQGSPHVVLVTARIRDYEE